MSVIDHRLAMVEAITRQEEHLLLSNPEAALELVRRKEKLLEELQRDIGPVVALCRPWTFYS